VRRLGIDPKVVCRHVEASSVPEGHLDMVDDAVVEDIAHYFLANLKESFQ